MLTDALKQTKKKLEKEIKLLLLKRRYEIKSLFFLGLDEDQE